MGAIFSVWQWAFQDGKEAYILILGLDASGKTTLLNRLKSNEGAATIPTIGFNSETIKYGRLTFSMFDIGGQNNLRGLWHHYYENCNAVVFVIDASDNTRFQEAKDEIYKLNKHPLLANIPFLFFANKQDLELSINSNVLTTKMELLKIRTREWKIVDSVATEGNGINDGFDWLSKNL